MTTKKNLSSSKLSSSESLLKDIRRNTKRIFTSEQKVLIIMEGIRGEQSIAELFRKYGISDSTYYKWNKEFIISTVGYAIFTEKFGDTLFATDSFHYDENFLF